MPTKLIIVLCHISTNSKIPLTENACNSVYNDIYKGWKNSFYTHFALPQPCAMLTKHFDLTQVCTLLFSNIERENGGAGTYSVGITAMSYVFAMFQHNLTVVVTPVSIFQDF